MPRIMRHLRRLAATITFARAAASTTIGTAIPDASRGTGERGSFVDGRVRLE